MKWKSFSPFKQCEIVMVQLAPYPKKMRSGSRICKAY